MLTLCDRLALVQAIEKPPTAARYQLLSWPRPWLTDLDKLNLGGFLQASIEEADIDRDHRLHQEVPGIVVIAPGEDHWGVIRISTQLLQSVCKQVTLDGLLPCAACMRPFLAENMNKLES